MRTIVRGLSFGPVLTASLMACSGQGQVVGDDEFSEQAEFGEFGQAVTLMDKPGTEAALAAEAGQDIEQVGAYTVYSANGDGHGPTTYEGSVQLFKNGAPLSSYQVRTPFPHTRIGHQVAMSENFVVTDVENYLVAPGQLKNMMMVVGKTNGEFTSCGVIGADGALPNCVTCTGSATTWQTQASCTPKAGVSLIEIPPGFDLIPTFELEGNELLIASRSGGSQIVPLKHNGSAWVFGGRINAPLPGEKIGGSMAISGNRLAVSATAPDGVAKYIYIYERADSNAAWRNVLRVDSPTPTVPGFGERLDLSGNYLVASDQKDVHFIEMSSSLSNPATAITAGCTARVQTQYLDVAIAGNRVVVASPLRLPLTFERTNSWNFFGGLPSGLFPEDVNPDGSSTLQSLWGAAIDGNRAAVGWRNYLGDDPSTVTGAALGFDFTEYGCGSQMGVPGAGLVRARRLNIDAVNAPNHTGFPETNVLDGSTNTRWRATATGNTQFEIDFGEMELLSHLQLNWGSVYARDYLIQISSDPDTVPANQRTWDWLTHVTNGDGGADFVVLRDNPQAFGRRLRLSLNVFGGTGDIGVSLTEVAAYGMVSSACGSKPSITCTTPATAAAPPHVCANDCGHQDENLGCFCDSGCVYFGDCCSPDGTSSGAQYFDSVQQVCSGLD